jgi:hypothetical protein
MKRAGGMLAASPRDRGGRPTENQSDDATGFATYADLGIDRRDAHRWQQVASLSREEFEGYIAETLVHKRASARFSGGAWRRMLKVGVRTRTQDRQVPGWRRYSAKARTLNGFGAGCAAWR